MSSSLGPSYLVQVVLTVGLLLVSAVIHEVAHGFVAHLCGDDTAKEAGRLTLNPAKHIDPMGSVVLPLVMAIAGGAVFAFAKPVPYNPWRLKNRRRDEVLVALAGPASNILQACAGAVLFNLAWGAIEANPALYFGPVIPVVRESPMGLLCTILASYVWVNLMLCFFNLIPLPPLDGSKVACFFLKGEALERYYQVQHYAMPILIVLLYVIPRLGVDPVGWYLDVTAGNLATLMLGA